MIRKILRYLLTPLNDFLRFLVIYMPGATGRKLRYLYYRGKFKKCGENVFIDEGVIIKNPEWVSVGDNVWIDKYCILIAGPVNLIGRTAKQKANKQFKWLEGELIIEDNIHIAPFCIIQAHGGVFIGKNSGFSSSVKVYSLSNLPTDSSNPSKIIYFTPLADPSSYYLSPILIEDNVGVALNSIILPGVTLGKNSFVAPNSIVLTSFKENSYISGDPAKRIRDRFKVEEPNE